MAAQLQGSVFFIDTSLAGIDISPELIYLCRPVCVCVRVLSIDFLDPMIASQYPSEFPP